MEKESLITYFTKDMTWVQPFTVGSLLIYISYAANNVETPDILMKCLIAIAVLIIGCITQGFFALNTHSLANCPKGEVKLANFKDVAKLFIIGLKYYLAAFLYGAGIGATGTLIVPIGIAGFSSGNFATMTLLVIWALAILYLIWMFIYMSFAYSRELSFRSMFKFSNFGKYAVGRYILCGLVFLIIACAVSFFFAIVIKDKTTFTYFINIILAPATMWYSLVLSKIQAESIQQAVAKEIK